MPVPRSPGALRPLTAGQRSPPTGSRRHPGHGESGRDERSAPTCTVTGLTNGDAYVFTVSAANGVGTGPSSPASGTVTPATLPGAPTIVSATAGNASATLTWSAPSSDGGSAITAYTVVAGDETTPANGGESCTWTSGPLTCTVTGLTNGDAYVFTVSATNGVGTGPSSPASGTGHPGHPSRRAHHRLGHGGQCQCHAHLERSVL